MKKINLIALAILCSTFSAKPMYQPILEQTCNFLAEVAPEISAVGASLSLAVLDERSDNKMMEPVTELVGNDSQGNDINIDDVMRDVLQEGIREGLNKASDDFRELKSGDNICSQF